jgi:hypothetical protein
MINKKFHIKTINKEFVQDGLELVKGSDYLYFVYDVPERNIYETKSVYVSNLCHMSKEEWIKEGKEFILEINSNKCVQTLKSVI